LKNFKILKLTDRILLLFQKNIKNGGRLIKNECQSTQLGKRNILIENSAQSKKLHSSEMLLENDIQSNKLHRSEMLLENGCKKFAHLEQFNNRKFL